MTEVVRARSLVRTFQTPAAPVHAVRQADLSVDAGEVVAIMGRSGSGKSTLMHILGLLDRADSGLYHVAGREVGGLGEKERCHLRATLIGFVFQAFHLIGHKSVSENVALPLMYSKVPRHERDQLVREALSQVGMLHRLDARPATLSGGERQRVAVARAVVHRPALMLCDEPTGNLDSANAEAVCELLTDLAAQRDMAVLLVTHDPATAAVAHRTVRMQDGVLRDATER